MDGNLPNGPEQPDMTNPFRIVHLSDLHLTINEGDCRSETNLFAPLRGMNKAFRRLLRTRHVQDSDLVLLTGDVTDRGDPDTWRVRPTGRGTVRVSFQLLADCPAICARSTRVCPRSGGALGSNSDGVMPTGAVGLAGAMCPRFAS